MAWRARPEKTAGSDCDVEDRVPPHVYGTGAGWQAVDVLLNGSISQVAVQRSDFRASVAAGDASALIANLQRKVAELSGGALPS